MSVPATRYRSGRSSTSTSGEHPTRRSSHPCALASCRGARCLHCAPDRLDGERFSSSIAVRRNPQDDPPPVFLRRCRNAGLRPAAAARPPQMPRRASRIGCPGRDRAGRDPRWRHTAAGCRHRQGQRRQPLRPGSAVGAGRLRLQGHAADPGPDEHGQLVHPDHQAVGKPEDQQPGQAGAQHLLQAAEPAGRRSHAQGRARPSASSPTPASPPASTTRVR